MNDYKYTDDELLAIANTVEPHDFDRVAPPTSVWNNVLAELEVAVASDEAAARRRAQPRLSTIEKLAVAAATVLLAGFMVVLATANNDGTIGVRQLAEATMTDEGLPVATTETAQAAVYCTDGDCVVRVDLTSTPEAGDGDLELWVINSDVTDMHSLGLVTESGDFPLPAGVDPNDFPIVDISVEPRDGVEAHSGQSVLRGVLAQT